MRPFIRMYVGLAAAKTICERRSAVLMFGVLVQSDIIISARRTKAEYFVAIRATYITFSLHSWLIDCLHYRQMALLTKVDSFLSISLTAGYYYSIKCLLMYLHVYSVCVCVFVCVCVCVYVCVFVCVCVQHDRRWGVNCSWLHATSSLGPHRS